MKLSGWTLAALVALAILLTSIGGSLDLAQKDRLFGISKEHYWNDGTILLLAAVGGVIILRCG